MPKYIIVENDSRNGEISSIESNVIYFSRKTISGIYVVSANSKNFFNITGEEIELNDETDFEKQSQEIWLL